MVNEQNYFHHMREILPKHRWESEGDWDKRAAFKFRMKESRVQAFKYGKPTRLTRSEELRLLSALKNENMTDMVIRVREIANDIITKGEELRDEEKKEMRRLLTQALNQCEGLCT